MDLETRSASTNEVTPHYTEQQERFFRIRDVAISSMCDYLLFYLNENNLSSVFSICETMRTASDAGNCVISEAIAMALDILMNPEDPDSF